MTGPTACKNNPIATAEHTPLVPPRSSCGFGNKKTHAKTVVFLLETISRAPSRRDAASCAASSAHRAFQRGAVPLSVPLADAAVTQAVPPGTLPRSLGVAWSPRPDPCAQRDGRLVAWSSRFATGLADWSVIGRPRPAGQRLANHRSVRLWCVAVLSSCVPLYRVYENTR